jgi:hypothetical protein
MPARPARLVDIGRVVNHTRRTSGPGRFGVNHRGPGWVDWRNSWQAGTSCWATECWTRFDTRTHAWLPETPTASREGGPHHKHGLVARTGVPVIDRNLNFTGVGNRDIARSR